MSGSGSPSASSILWFARSSCPTTHLAYVRKSISMVWLARLATSAGGTPLFTEV